METPAFYFRSWAELRDHDKLAYDAFRAYAEGIPDGPWALHEAFRMEKNGQTYSVELKSMSTQKVVNIVFQRSGLDYSVESFSST